MLRLNHSIIGSYTSPCIGDSDPLDPASEDNWEELDSINWEVEWFAWMRDFVNTKFWELLLSQNWNYIFYSNWN